MVNQQFYELGTAPSVIRQLFAYGLEQAAKVGADKVFDYSLGNPSIPAPKKVNESIHTIVDTTDSIQLHGYSMANGFDNARAAVAKDLSDRFDLDVKASELFLTCGAAPALISIIKALVLDSDSEIMAVAPFFPEYRPFVTAKLVVVPADTQAFQIHLDAVEQRITPHTQAIIINSPNNPSGVVYTEETLRGLAVLLERKSAEYDHPIYIIADEPYRELVYGDVTVPFIPCLYRNTIVCYSYSKSLSLPGERIGYVYVPGFADDSAAVYAAVSGAARVMGHVCPPTLMQKVIQLCAGERPDLAAYDENRNLLYNSLREMGYECAKPDGAFYLFVKAPNGDANVFSEKAKLGYNLLMPDQRAHGRSDSYTITMGAQERYDARAWAYWASVRSSGKVPIFLMGVSMGAATVLLASGLDLPDSVHGIIADCGYSSIRDICRTCLPKYLPHVPVGPGYAVGKAGAKIFGRFDPDTVDCRKAVAQSKVPILFIHGSADDFVPCSMSRENYDACASEKELLVIPGATHAMSYYYDTPAYTKAVTDFLKKHI